MLTEITVNDQGDHYWERGHFEIASSSRMRERWKKAFSNLSVDLKIVLGDLSDTVIKEPLHGGSHAVFHVFRNKSVKRNLIPLTPWMIVHRFYHAAQGSYFDTVSIEDMCEVGEFGKIAQRMFPSTDKFRDNGLHTNTRHGILLGELFGTMKSAIALDQNNIADTHAEYATQMIITGKISTVDYDCFTERLDKALIKYGGIDTDRNRLYSCGIEEITRISDTINRTIANTAGRHIFV